MDLFYIAPIQRSVGKGIWVDACPIAFVLDSRQIGFEFEGKQREFLDLAYTLLYVSIQLVKTNGSEINSGNKVVPVNVFLHTSFGQLGITLGVGMILDGSSTYHYRAYLETLLSYGEETKNTYLTSFLFHKDTAAKMDECASCTSKSNVVDVIKTSWRHFQSSKIFVGYGKSVYEATMY